MNDEGFREIQLNGKQLVFLFMAATVVSVVIFLCGVLVGRGVRGPGPAADATSADIAPDADRPIAAENTEPQPAPSSGTAAGSAGTAAPRAEELSYVDRLLRDSPPEEKLKATPAPAPREPVAKQPPAAAPPPPPAPAAATNASDPSGPGFAVQVAISRDRREADTLAKELIAKGYPAFVMDPAKGAPAGIYRVRVGKYKSRQDAEQIAARLKSVEQFAPWIAR